MLRLHQRVDQIPYSFCFCGMELSIACRELWVFLRIYFTFLADLKKNIFQKNNWLMKGSIHKKCQHFKEDDCTLSVHLFLFLQFISFGIQLIPTQVLRKEKAFKHLFRLMIESNNQSCGHLFRLKATLHMFKISVSTAASGIKLSYRSEKLGYSINVVSSIY